MNKKRIASLLLTVAMVLTMLPTGVISSSAINTSKCRVSDSQYCLADGVGIYSGTKTT